MSKKLFIVLISVIGGLCALTAAFATFMLIREKHKSDEAELEHYLDSSIL